MASFIQVHSGIPMTHCPNPKLQESGGSCEWCCERCVAFRREVQIPDLKLWKWPDRTPTTMLLTFDPLLRHKFRDVISASCFFVTLFLFHNVLFIVCFLFDVLIGVVWCKKISLIENQCVTRHRSPWSITGRNCLIYFPITFTFDLWV